ncbi:MAG: AMP-binding protein [Pseudomonadota bacterium]
MPDRMAGKVAVNTAPADKAKARRIHKNARKTIFQAVIAAGRRFGSNRLAVIDGDEKQFTYKELIRAGFALGGPIARRTCKSEAVGVLLPTGAGAVITILALHARGRVPAMLNFTAGAGALISAAKAAKVTKVLTARKFVEIGGLEKLIDALKGDLEIIYLEDLKEVLSPLDKARALVGPLVPALLAANTNPDDPGAILFTSGTEGKPKGVVLSHANILSNIHQIDEHVETQDTDIVFNPLPMFHCYGLTAGTLWPIMVGHPAVLHPSPLQTKIIPKRIKSSRATIVFATDTFLTQYMRAGDAESMQSLRIAVCGAERVKNETRHMASREYSFEVLEGYGVTEASPVVAVNQPGDIRDGTVGTLLPTLEYRLKPVEGLDGAGRLFVRGPSIMKGYVSEDAPGVIRPLRDGWHDTGDIVSVDDDGYISIRGRIKRFAKIGGEMVSLAIAENCASAVWPDNMHATTMLPDKRRGEQIILVTDKKSSDRSPLLLWAQSHGVAEIALPKKIIEVDEVPVLGTGKTDYVKVEALARDALAREAVAARNPATAAPETNVVPISSAEETETNAGDLSYKNAAE